MTCVESPDKNLEDGEVDLDELFRDESELDALLYQNRFIDESSVALLGGGGKGARYNNNEENYAKGEKNQKDEENSAKEQALKVRVKLKFCFH